jgi:hypothetical protein
MDRDTALAKIKKCLALAKSSNANEAATALRQAQKLMEQFDLNELDISLADVKEAEQPAVSNAIPQWEANLSKIVAEAFGCEVFLKTGRKLTYIGSTKKTKDYTFVGIGPAAEVAAYAFRVLSRQCARDRQLHVAEQSKRLKPKTRTARGDAFALAWVYAVERLIERFANSERNTELLDAHMSKNYPDMGSVKPKNRHISPHVRDQSWLAGRQAGEKARLDRGIGANASTPLIA